MSMKESLRKVQKNLESAKAEIEKLYDIVDDLEKTVGGVAPTKAIEATPVPKKKLKSKPHTKGTATERVLTLINSNPDGISTDAIIKDTGLERKTVYGILNRAKSRKKVKSPKRGIYVLA